MNSPALPLVYTSAEAIDLAMLTLLLGREAGNQSRDAMIAVAWSVKNRVTADLARWGHGWVGVITARWQYSSVVGPKDDPNLQKYPNLKFAPWADCLAVAEIVYRGQIADPTEGAQSYFDKSIDANPPVWATDGEYEKTVDIGAFHFFRLAHR